MKKILFTALIVLLAFAGYSQLNNSWIDYSKTYYKFKINKDTLCRIYQPALSAVGLGSTPAQNFQLWRNGKEVRLYTSIASGVLGATDYIEFWGEMNDGKPDKILYLDTTFQLDDKYSLFSDTASYYLTVNATTPNLRYVQSANPVAGNVLPADAYFMRRVEGHYKDQLNRGYAADLTELIYSSSFDIGEGWSSNDINSCCALSNVVTGVNRYAAGPANSVTFTVSAFGNALYSRDLSASLNGTKVLPTPNPMPYYTFHKDTIRNIPLSALTSPTFIAVSIQPVNSSNPSNDRIVVPCFSVTYPATFDFNSQKSFYFELAPSATGNYLVINNFNNNGIPPALYDITNGLRYLGDISTAGQVKFVLPASASPVRKFNLVSEDVSNYLTVNNLTSKTFLDVSNPANQGDYIIISNPVLYNDGSGNNYVEQYRQYRSSAAGGSYNAKVYDINELTEQFGFGINKHPSSIRDFIRYASVKFANKPKFVFLIGRAVTYQEYNANAANPDVNKLNLVPTFGWPASDALLSSAPGTFVPLIPIGRIGAIAGNEVGNYLEKMKQYELAQRSTSQTVADQAWTKNIIHVAGGVDSIETASFLSHLNQYKLVAQDTSFGAYVETFAKSSTGSIQQESSTRIEQLFQEGLSFIGYFGHSSANVLAFNFSSPESYNNQGKYPFFNVSGCSAGNFFNFDPARLAGSLSISERYILTSQKGSIGFLADTHFGIEPFLHQYNTNFYNEFTRNNYGGTVGEQMKQVSQNIGGNPQSLDYYSRIHLEELALQGDPALRINTHTKPDYVMEEQLIKISPSIISVADRNFNLNVKMLNIGKAINDSIRITVKHKLPDGSVKVLVDSMILAIKYSDSVVMVIPINPITDKGLNSIIVSLDVTNRVSELSETNNTAEKQFYIYEDELKPVAPYDYSIVNKQNITFTANTANPLVQQRQYVMEIDTTQLFNSSFMKSFTASGNGGIVEFKPTGLTFTDSTVYYWRVAIVPVGANPNYIWNGFSFIYLANSSTGFNQSHYFQHLASSRTNIAYDNNRTLQFQSVTKTITMKNGVFPTAAKNAEDFEVDVDADNSIQSVCGISNIIINAFNPFGFTPIPNSASGPGLYGSDPVCGPTRRWNFQYNILNQASRKAAMQFLDQIPNGYYVTVRNTSGTNPASNTYANDWQADTLAFGSGNSLYHRLKNAGFADVDSFNRPRAFNFIYKKNDNSFIPAWDFSLGINDKIQLVTNCSSTKVSGTIVSPSFGPSKKWTALHWQSADLHTPATDVISVDVFGVDNNGANVKLATVKNPGDTTLSFIDAATYPFVYLQMNNADSIYGDPSQLKYWRINADFVPEGTIAPNILYQMRDTVDQGDMIDFKIAFKNISPANFDSAMKIKLTITDNNNLPHVINLPKGKILIAGDTLAVGYKIDTKGYPGNNTLFLDVNPNNDQPEQAHFNNVLFKDFYVRPDNYNPLLDVTFDGVHILNKDIVAAKPHIFIKLKDESKFLALTDTSLLKVQVRYPDNSLRNYNFGDTMRFNPANLASGENTASIDFTPYFPLDGQYELIVTGKDVVGNKAGALEYHILFSVINKPMISNLLNYPNPFTTSTAFVFTVTGSVVPQNMRIQILTISGKVVREITKDELGPIHIGRNITEFKWDGTDMYGQKLANGVYLYRVLTNLNGKSLDKYKESGDNTDQFFTKGYGKMVIIR